MSYADDVAAATAAVAAAQTAVAAAQADVATAQAAVTVAINASSVATLALTRAQADLTYLLENPPPPPPPPVVKRPLLGMSAPDSLWDQRVKEVGPGLQARRLFYTSFTASLSLAKAAIAAGQLPVISYKVPSWSGVAQGKYDGDLRALAVSLAALGGPVFVALHHEPAGDGLAADWAAMQVHALPILKAGGSNITVGCIGNGWWFNTSGGYTDAQLATYFTPAVRKVSDVIAADTYQMTAGAEGPGPKMKRMAAWARRVGDVKALGVGEFNAQSAADISNACAALKNEPLFAWGLLWNSDTSTVTHLSGDRLAAFKSALAAWNT